jgi:hypothetical protein
MDTHEKLKMRMRQMKAQRGAGKLEDITQRDVSGHADPTENSANSLISSIMNIQSCKGVSERKKKVVELFNTMRGMDQAVSTMVIKSVGISQFKNILTHAIKDKNCDTYTHFMKLIKSIDADQCKTAYVPKMQIVVPPMVAAGKKKKKKRKKKKQSHFGDSIPSVDCLSEPTPPLQLCTVRSPLKPFQILLPRYI